jgi:pimeloyl-ACP methyl ester carboxylesterase
MKPVAPQFIEIGHHAASRRIAYLVARSETNNAGPGLMWLAGFKSEMTSLKASALATFAEERGLAMTRFDYSGHGMSDGRFEDGTIGRWLEEATTIFRQFTEGPQILIGSSMGGYIALLTLRQLMRDEPEHAARIRGLVLIAPAWDMTAYIPDRLGADAMREIEKTGVYLRPSAYGDGPYPITKGLIEDGQKHLIGTTAFDPGRPVRVLHGLLDPDVPSEHSTALAAHLSGGWVRISFITDGDHRLSRPEDLDLLIRTVEEFLPAPDGGPVSKSNG